MSPDPPAAATAAAAAAVVRRYHDKEEFVTGHAGTTPQEVFLLCLVAPVGLLLHRKVRPHVVAVLGRRVGGGGRGVVAVAAAFVAEFLMLILPMMIVQTSLLPRYVGPCLLLAGMSILASSVGPPPSSGGAMTGGDTAAEEMTIQQDVGEDFSGWTYRQLRDKLYELNVPIKKAWRKQDLVDWLQNHRPANRKSEVAASIAPEKVRRRPSSLYAGPSQDQLT